MKFVSAFTALMFAPVASFAGTITPPEGCEAFLTLQAADCQVEHYWSCEGEPEGVKWRYSVGEDGPLYMSQIDSEYRWLYSRNLIDGFENTMSKPEKNPQSMSRLRDTGEDSFDFFEVVGYPGSMPARRHVVGQDILTGEVVEIDGQRLLETNYQISETTGSNVFEGRGQEYVLEEFNLFIGGEGRYRNNGGAWESYNSSPITFARPGEDGFLSDTPQYGCGAMMSSLPGTPEIPAG